MIDDTFFFFFFLEMHKILYFWNCNWSSSVYCAQTGGGQRFGTLVMWTRLYQFMRWPKWNTPTVHKHPTRPPHRRRSSVPPQRFFSLPETSTVQIFSCLTLIGTHPSAAAHKLWMAVDRPGSRLSWRWVICTAYSEQRSRLWTRTRHYSIRAMTSVISLPAKGRSLAAGSSLVQCRRFSLARSLAVVAPWCKERRLYAAHVTGKIWL